MPSELTQVVFKAPKEDYEMVKLLASLNDLSKGRILRQALAEYLAKPDIAEALSKNIAWSFFKSGAALYMEKPQEEIDQMYEWSKKEDKTA